MPKTSGLGDNLLVAGYDLSGDVGALSGIHQGRGIKEVTAINKSAVERMALQADGKLGFKGWWDTDTGAIHDALRTMPTTDVLVSYLRGTTRGSRAAVMMAKQASYDPDRGDDGALAVSCEAEANGYGLAWGYQLTAGVETIAAAGNSAGVDLGYADSIGVTPVASLSSTSNSVANPTSILFASPHGIVTGDSVEISGQASGTPLINGDRACTYVDSTHFTVPVNVTVIGGAATVKKTSTNYGAAMFVQVVTHGSNSITIKVQHSADNGVSDAYADVAGLTTGAISAKSAGLRIQSTSTTAIVKRYARIVTSGTFANAIISVVLVRYGAPMIV